MLNSRLHGLPAAGQSVWSDQISRSMIDSGELERRITEDAISGVTSNPTIFADAITKSSDYDRSLRELAKSRPRRQRNPGTVWSPPTSPTPATFFARSGSGATAATGSSRSR